MSHPTFTPHLTLSRFSTPLRRARAALAALSRRTVRRLSTYAHDDSGLSTIEYAMGTLAAAALAGVLYVVVNSGAVSDAIQGIITDALNNTPG